MERVVVTGATSMLGVALIKECIKNGIKVLALVRKDSRHIDRLPKSELLETAACSLDQLAAVSSGVQYDVFYHFAWEGTGKSHRNDPQIQELNIRYTLDAVNLAKRLGCRKFIGAGSQAEYGKVDGVIAPETTTAPATAYGIAKFAAGKLSEKLCTQYGMRHIWARVFSVYGSLDHEETMLNYAMECFRKREAAQFSAAVQLWDYLYEADAGKIFYLLGERVEQNKVYCIASGKSRPLKEYILELRELWGADAECIFGAQKSADVISLQADISELVRDIGYRPDTEFRDGISAMLRRKQKNKE